MDSTVVKKPRLADSETTGSGTKTEHPAKTERCDIEDIESETLEKENRGFFQPVEGGSNEL